MKRSILLLIAGCCSVSVAFGQDMLGATLDGRKVILHENGTWEYKTKLSQATLETVTLIDFDKQEIAADLAAGTSKKVKLTLYVRNAGTKPVRAWKANLAVKNHFDEVLFYTKIEKDNLQMQPTEVTKTEFVWEDIGYSENDIYDQLASYKKDQLKLSLNDIRLVQ